MKEPADISKFINMVTRLTDEGMALQKAIDLVSKTYRISPKRLRKGK